MERELHLAGDLVAGRPHPLRLGPMAVEVADQDEELVAALAGDQVAGPRHRPEPLGHLAQELVAGGVAEAVVHELEVVEVDEEHGRARARSGARGPATSSRCSLNIARFGRPVSGSW